MLDPALLAALTARLEASRAVLFSALDGVTEQDFGVDLGGETVVQALAALAVAEHLESAEAMGETPPEHSSGRPLPPQVVHALAGARYATRRYLESAAAEAGAAEAMVANMVEQETALAERIRQRPRLEPPPAISMADR